MKSLFNKIIYYLIDLFILIIGFPLIRLALWVSDKWEDYKARKKK